ncbi:MAG: hypothetical protein MUC77_18115 [Chromatiaceae bacterium]|jgi:hypothetical protein|nr:hypothetical protein [Chromatiaceae bacterium]
MQAVRLNAVLGDDHRLQVVVPEEIPVGEVEVIVLATSPTPARAEQTLSELFAELDRMPHRRLTKEEVDRYIAEERASWD